MREIKFRGYCKGVHKWIFGQLIKDHYSNEFTILEEPIRYILGHGWRGEFPYKIEQDTIGQYIGLKDENEVEIYEGDILRLNHKHDAFSNGGCIPDQDNICVGYVVFDNDFSGWCVHIVESDNEMVTRVGCELPIYIFSYNSGYEVIGNIFDNPELIENEFKNKEE